MVVNSLSTLSVLSDCITIVQKENIKLVRVQHPKAKATISLLGAHVVSFQPAGESEIIWMSEKAIWNGQAALRGGIPVCWPWFARAATPMHGFARNNEWQLIEHRENESGVLVSLGLKPTPATLEIWPHQFEAILHIEISEKLTVTLEVKNTDQTEWAFSGALHSYFNIGDIRQTNITGMGDHYIDSLQQGKVCLGGDTLSFNTGIDRVYTTPKEIIEINDVANDRVIQVTNHGESAAVIWNPWELAANMQDMEDDGYQTMVCVESTLYAPTLEEGKVLQPGESHKLMTAIRIKP